MSETDDVPVPDESEYKVTFDKTSVTCARPDGTSEAVDWTELEAVTIEATQADAPHPKFIWILWGEERLAGIVFPGRADGADALLAEIKTKLSGFDHKALVTALNTEEHQTFIIWEMNVEMGDGGSSENKSGGDKPNPFLIN